MRGIPPITEGRRDDKTDDEADPVDILVLPHHELVLAKVCDVIERRLRVQFEKEPADVRPEKAL